MGAAVAVGSNTDNVFQFPVDVGPPIASVKAVAVGIIVHCIELVDTAATEETITTLTLEGGPPMLG